MPATAQRVLMTTDTVGGVWSYTLDLLREYAGKNVHTLLVSQGRMPTDEQQAEIKRIDKAELVPTQYKLEWMDDPWIDVNHCGELLIQLERDFSPDVIHLNGYAQASLPFRAPKIVVAHSCVLSWWRAVYGCAAPETEWARYQAEVQAGLSAANLVVAPTRAMLDLLAAEYSFDTPSKVIYNGSPRTDNNLRRFPRKKAVFAAGRIWDQAKNIAALCKAAGGIEAQVYVAGECSDADRFQSLAPENLTLLGQLSRMEVADWMHRTEIYCLPALYEPFGLSILEAARAGCALVLGDIPTMRELWDEDCACFVDPRDPNMIAETINELLRDDAKRKHLQINALKRSQQYQSAAMAATYLSEYNRLIGIGNTFAHAAN